MATVKEKMRAKRANKKNQTLDIHRAVNFTIITSEYQTALKIASKLRKVVPEIYHSKIAERLASLEQESQNELLLAFNVPTKKGQLETTPIYPEPAMDDIFKMFADAVKDYYSDTTTTGLRDVALCRQQSEVTYTLNSPIHRIGEFLAHPEYQAILADENFSEERLNKIHETLLFVFLLPSSRFGELFILDWDIYDKDTVETLLPEDVIV